MRYPLAILLLLAALLAACAPAVPASQVPPPTAGPQKISVTPTDDPALLPTLFPNSNADGDKGMNRVDEQGMVVVEVTPTNLGTPSDTLNFEVAMNTHSVNLDMNLAQLATLTTDSGVSLQASQWDAPPGGGHHVSGTLIFPARQGGKSILEGATKLTLTIVSVDAPARVFEWELK